MPFRADEILPHLPLLRRHARLLTGSTELGDNYVRLCLELILAEPERVKGEDIHCELLEALYAAWASPEAPQERSPLQPSRQRRLDRGIGALPRLRRRVLLLSVVEKLRPEQVSRILKIRIEEVGALLAEAKDSIEKYAETSVLIIEDEPFIALELSLIVQEMGMTVLASVAEHEAAVAAAENQPALVLADIQLQRNDNGIAAARDILGALDVPIVFVTGFPERLLTGDSLEPAFVVAKPYSKEALKAVIAQALDLYDLPLDAVEHRAHLLDKLNKITDADTPYRRAE